MNIIMNILKWIFEPTRFLGLVTLFVAVMTYIVNKRSKDISEELSKRDKDRYNHEVDSKAREFISKYSLYEDPQIDLLLFCVMAAKFKPTYSYKRQIYTDFNILPIDVQNKILEIYHYNIDCQYEPDFYNVLKNFLKTTIQIHYNNEDFRLYEPTAVGTTDYLFETYKLDYTVNKNIEQSIVELFRLNNNISCQINNMFTSANDIDVYTIICETTKNIVRFSIKDDSDYNINKLIYPDYLTYSTTNFTTEDLFLQTLLTLYLYKNIDKEICDNEV